VGGSAGADPGVEIGGHIGPYGERGTQAYNGGLGAVPPAGSRAKPPPAAEHFCVVIRLKWRNAAML